MAADAIIIVPSMAGLAALIAVLKVGYVAGREKTKSDGLSDCVEKLERQVTDFDKKLSNIDHKVTEAQADIAWLKARNGG